MTEEKQEYTGLIQDLLDSAEDDWGDTEQNRLHMVRYGIATLDKALLGLDTDNGELIVVYGAEKKRKTTFVVNTIINYMTAPLPVQKPPTMYDSLESGMPPKRIRDMFITNLASRRLIDKGHYPHSLGRCPVCKTEICQELIMRPEILKYHRLSRSQEDAKQWAMDTMYEWPLSIFGSRQDQGKARNLVYSVRGDEDRDARWHRMIEERGVEIIVSDHAQQYATAGRNVFDKLAEVVDPISNFVAEEGCVIFLVSQISLTSLRESKSGGMQYATGGKRASEEANVIFGTDYENSTGRMKISILESRRSPSLDVIQDLDDTSGAFYKFDNVVEKPF